MKQHGCNTRTPITTDLNLLFSSYSRDHGLSRLSRAQDRPSSRPPLARHGSTVRPPARHQLPWSVRCFSRYQYPSKPQQRLFYPVKTASLHAAARLTCMPSVRPLVYVPETRKMRVHENIVVCFVLFLQSPSLSTHTLTTGTLLF